MIIITCYNDHFTYHLIMPQHPHHHHQQHHYLVSLFNHYNQPLPTQMTITFWLYISGSSCSLEINSGNTKCTFYLFMLTFCLCFNFFSFQMIIITFCTICHQFFSLLNVNCFYSSIESKIGKLLTIVLCNFIDIICAVHYQPHPDSLRIAIQSRLLIGLPIDC